MKGSKSRKPDADNDDLAVQESDELAMLVQLCAAHRAQTIVGREGAALVQAVRNSDEAAIETSLQLLADMIGKAITLAYFGNIGDEEAGLLEER